MHINDVKHIHMAAFFNAHRTTCTVHVHCTRLYSLALIVIKSPGIYVYVREREREKMFLP